MMKIKCINLINENNYRAQGIQIGREYYVIAVHIIAQSEGCIVRFNVVNDNGILSMYNYNHFMILDNKIEHDWIMKNKNSNFTFLPLDISYDSFFEDFHNDEQKAIEIFKIRFPELSKKLF